MKLLSVILMASLPAFATPQFELSRTWFGMESAPAVTNGLTVAKTAAGLVFTPQEAMPATAPVSLRATVVFAEDDVGAARRLAPPAVDVPFALTVAATARARLAYFGWTADGWVELAGAEPAIGMSLAVGVDVDFGVSPAEVRYVANGATLTSADGSGRSAFVSAVSAADRFDGLVSEGHVEVVRLAGERELIERVAAVVKDDAVTGYFPTLAAARAVAATDGGAVTLLRRATLADPTGLDGVFDVNGSALKGGAAVLTYTGDPDALAKVRSVVQLPQGYDLDIPFFSPASAAALAALHVHGDEGVPYTLYPKNGAFNLRKDELGHDGGDFTAFFTVPEAGRSYLRGLKDEMCGSEKALYVNGLGELTLCGTNGFSGRVFLEASRLVAHGSLASASAEVLTGPADIVLAVDSAEGVPGHAALADRTVFFSGADDALTFTVDPGRGRLAYLKREGANVVVRLAGRPEMAETDGFTVTASADEEGRMVLRATLANAVQGFRYGWCAADAPNGTFAPVGEMVEALRDGSLAVMLEEPAAERRFYRFRVEAP